MDYLDLAVVIPSLNEEHYIGKLLDSISEQIILPKEVVVIDAQSQDKTIEEIKKRQSKSPNLKYYQIPKYTISRQRNFGASKTKATHLLFLDADVVLKGKDDLKLYFENILKETPDIAFCQNSPISNQWKDKVLFKAGFLMMKFSKLLWPTTVSINLYVKRSSFEKIGGFDEEIRVAEDFEILQRMTKKGYKYSIFNQPEIFSSVRRWRSGGRIRVTLLLLRSLFYITIFGYRKNPIKYEFGKHDPI